ncbi:MAG: glycoside hydrolase family 3 N-terminal domain-containing protein [Gemmatimonadota bacterium]
MAWAREAGRIVGEESRAIGIHLAFAPTVDVNNNPANPGSTSEATSNGSSARRCNAFTLAATSIGEPSDITTPPTLSTRTRSAASAKVWSVVLV